MLGPLTSGYERLSSVLRSIDWAGPLIVRLTLGVVFLTTGWGKLHDLASVARFFESLHIPAPHANAVFVSSVELVGGGLLLLGLATRLVALFLIGVMAVALWTARLPELHGVIELAATIELTYLVAFVWLLVSGGGIASADHLLTRRRQSAQTAVASERAAIA